MNKKQILILILITVLIAAGIMLIIKLNSTKPPVSSPPSTATSTTGTGILIPNTYNDEGLPIINLPKKTKLQIVKLSDDENKVLDYWFNKNNDNIYYFTQEGNVFIAKENSDLNISSQEINAINYILPSPSGKLVLVAFGDPKNPSWGLFDTVDQVWRPINNKIIQVTWGGDDGKLIAVIKNDTENILAWVKVEDAILQNEKLNYLTIAHNFNFLDIKIHYLGNNELMVYEKPATNYLSKVFIFNTKKRTIKLITQAEGLYLNIFSDQDTIIEFENPSKFIITNNHFSKNSIWPQPTFPDKCTVDNRLLIYCFYPDSNLFYQSTDVLSDYLQRKFYTKDKLEVFEKTGQYGTILSLKPEKDIPLTDSTMVKTDDKNNLYFINRYNWALYKIKLPQLNLNSPAEENKTATSSTSTVAD